ncbi:unnamed protein product [Acanthoscelides obtectus]|uniref:Uncharacterized protein n=1 Tax=Acanthoscelides obtectus TaxID=200917 RepID=A0A9P0KIK0_ACAOB|nr:unnamed protein product [Acanthoscelides obtectus]CAK1654535.1 hypothetical protein AOBTE_LOCUS18660 [Acanthoscelides obtectus]
MGKTRFLIILTVVVLVLVAVNAHSDEVLCTEPGRNLCENGNNPCIDCCVKKLNVSDVGCWAGECYCLIFD